MALIDDYYIIESLGGSDIKDGKIFFDSLNTISGFNPKYKKVSNFNELKKALTDFEQSNFKYLLISSHGDEENLHLTDETVNSYDLFDIDLDLSKKRIFMSSCRGGSYLIAKYFIKKGAYSVIGSPDDLDQIVAVALWPTMVLTFERLNDFEVNFRELDIALKQIVNVYRIPMHYYSFLRDEKKLKEYVYMYDKKRKRTDYEL